MLGPKHVLGKGRKESREGGREEKENEETKEGAKKGSFEGRKHCADTNKFELRKMQQLCQVKGFRSKMMQKTSRRTRYRPRISAEHCVSPQWQRTFVVPSCLNKNDRLFVD